MGAEVGCGKAETRIEPSGGVVALIHFDSVGWEWYCLCDSPADSSWCRRILHGHIFLLLHAFNIQYIINKCGNKSVTYNHINPSTVNSQLIAQITIGHDSSFEGLQSVVQPGTFQIYSEPAAYLPWWLQWWSVHLLYRKAGPVRWQSGSCTWLHTLCQLTTVPTSNITDRKQH